MEANLTYQHLGFIIGSFYLETFANTINLFPLNLSTQKNQTNWKTLFFDKTTTKNVAGDDFPRHSFTLASNRRVESWGHIGTRLYFFLFTHKNLVRRVLFSEYTSTTGCILPCLPCIKLVIALADMMIQKLFKNEAHTQLSPALWGEKRACASI